MTFGLVGAAPVIYLAIRAFYRWAVLPSLFNLFMIYWVLLAMKSGSILTSFMATFALVVMERLSKPKSLQDRRAEALAKHAPAQIYNNQVG